MEDVTLTLAFDLEAVRRFEDPATVIESASQWSEHVGIVSDRPPHVLTKFTRDHAINQEFAPDPTEARVTLDHMREHYDTGRYVHIGTEDHHRERAEATDWEYLDVEAAAEMAGWKLTSSESTEPKRTSTSTDDWP